MVCFGMSSTALAHGHEKNEATPTRGCFVVYKEQWVLRLLDFDDGDAGAAETDVFVAIVRHAADGVEILADDGA